MSLAGPCAGRRRAGPYRSGPGPHRGAAPSAVHFSLVRPLRSLFLSVGAALGTFFPFLVVILQERGLDAAAIGAVTAASSVAFGIAVPFWGHLGDVTLGRIRALQIGAIASAVVVILFGLPFPALVAAGLVALAIELWGAAPAVFEVGVGAASLELGDRLSPTVERALPGVVDAVAAIVAEHAPR